MRSFHCYVCVYASYCQVSAFSIQHMHVLSARRIALKLTMKTNLLMFINMLSLLRKSRSFHLSLNLVFSRRPPATSASTLTRLFSALDQNMNANDAVQKHIVEWKTSDGTIYFEAFDGETLRTAALRRGIVSPHNGRARLINCRGLGTCGTCAVEVETMDSVEPRQRNAVERARLKFPPHGEHQSPNLRLACQVQIRGDVGVTKRTGFWGQYSDLAKQSQAKTYFGDYEFILDRKSPSES